MRKGLAAFAVAFAMGTGSAGAITVQLGEVAPPINLPPASYCLSCSQFQISVAPGSAPYTVPAAPASGPWVVTSWRAQASTGSAGAARLQIWRPGPRNGEFTMIADSAEASIAAGQATPNPVSIPVQPGDVLGMRTGVDGSVPTNYPGAAGDSVMSLAGGVPMPGSTAGLLDSSIAAFSFEPYRVNISATLTSEPPSPPPPPPTGPERKQKCKKKRKKQQQRLAEAAKKKSKKCKKKKAGKK